MKSIGFIDYYLNEWHADNYPAWIHEASGGEYEVRYAYAMIEPPIPGAMSNADWARLHDIELVPTIEALIEKSDCIVVLSPDNSEMHYTLSHQALESGKCVYIDKTFADSRDEAERIFSVARASGAPCFSSSALRFSQKLAAISQEGIESIISIGTGRTPEIYLIHQLEPLAVLMGTQVQKVLFTGSVAAPAWTLRFADGKSAHVHFSPAEAGYSLRIYRQGAVENICIDDDFFSGFIAAMLDFFRSGKPPVSPEDTARIMAIREACLAAMQNPDAWCAVS